ncbi:MAG: hypothetical protein KJO38_07555, partial [Gammaproteobacteria bacterium]|nr:hypothetical protein [Gammaproteobacteria bacterium]
MSEHDDKQFEAYLAGDSPLSEHYRRAGEDGPPAALDARVLEHAHRAIAGPVATRRRWIAPLSTAAVIVLAAALVLEMTLPGARQDAVRNMEQSVSSETVPHPSGSRDESPGMDPAEAAADRELVPVTDAMKRVALRKRETDNSAVPAYAPAPAADAAQQKSLARAERHALAAEPGADDARERESAPSGAPPVAYAGEPPALASVAPMADAPEAA